MNECHTCMHNNNFVRCEVNCRDGIVEHSTSLKKKQKKKKKKKKKLQTLKSGAGLPTNAVGAG